MADYYFNFQGARIDNGSSGIHTFIAGDVQATPASDAIVTELREIRRKLEKSEPLLAAAVCNLEQAVRAQDKPTISKIVQQLSVGTAASVFANLSSNGLMTFLGLR